MDLWSGRAPFFACPPHIRDGGQLFALTLGRDRAIIKLMVELIPIDAFSVLLIIDGEPVMLIKIEQVAQEISKEIH